jgi:hypothetical protein
MSEITIHYGGVAYPVAIAEDRAGELLEGFMTNASWYVPVVVPGGRVSLFLAGGGLPVAISGGPELLSACDRIPGDGSEPVYVDRLGEPEPRGGVWG